jgi:hypothetical protein
MAVLQNSLNIYVLNRAPSAETTTSASTSPSLTQSTIVQAYAGFAPVLTQVISHYQSNPSISGSAQQALALINSIVPVVTH